MTDHPMVEMIAGKIAENLVEIRGLTMDVTKD